MFCLALFCFVTGSKSEDQAGLEFTVYVAQAGLELGNLPASPSQGLKL